MPRPRSPHVAEVKGALAARLRDDLVQPGGRFLSARAVAQRFSVSYQTAHRLLAELATEGLLARRAASGSYHPGERATLRGVQLVFHPRARRKGSFGAHLLERLSAALAARGLTLTHSWPEPDATPRLRRDLYPIFWESRPGLLAAAAARTFALCLNDHPPVGLAGARIDAVTTDDYSGGACAAELLKTRTSRDSRFIILAGPKTDRRSQQRVAGFEAHTENTQVIRADTWFVEAGLARAADVLNRRPAGIFACNDRLAEALIVHCRKNHLPLPPLVGFDNAPIAEHLRLTTIGIPWQAMVAHAVEIAAARLAGSTAPARVVTLAHEPISRLTA